MVIGPVVFVTVYATLVLMSSLSGYLRDRSLLTLAFVSGMLLVGTASMTLVWVRKKWSARRIK